MLHHGYSSDGPPVRTAIIGAGNFGGVILSQSAFVPAVRVDLVVDSRLDIARAGLRDAGVTDEQIAECATHSEARRALEAGQRVITSSAAMISELEPIEVVVESTAIPEAGARHARDAITAGKHVAMVNKETDAAVGPILKKLADSAGVVYTAVDGDQHGLLIKLVRWARTIGLDVVCGGKLLDVEIIRHDDPPSLTRWGGRLNIAGESLDAFDFRPSDDLSETIARRGRALKHDQGAKPWDLVELTIAANATGLVPDVPTTHTPALWTTEIPAVLCPRDLGGLLGSDGRIDAVQIIRRPHELTLQGGVFLVVRVQSESMRRIMISSEAVMHRDGRTALIVWPHHLLGIEAIGSILAAGRSHTATGAIDYRPAYDVVYRAARDLHPADTLGDDHSDAITAEMLPNVGSDADAPLPSGLAQHARLIKPIHRGKLITRDAVHRPIDSVLWSLRDLQDKEFFEKS